MSGNRPLTRTARIGLTVAVALILVLAGLFTYVILRPPPGAKPNPIQHIIYVVMENRAYDHFFGTYCQQTGPYCPNIGDGLPPGLCLPRSVSDPSQGCVRPYDLNATSRNSMLDLPHNWQASHLAFNNGSMNNFYSAENNSTEPFGHFNGSTIPVYWDMAQQFALGDRFFASALDFSLPNHWHLVAGQSPAVFDSHENFLKDVSRAHEYLNLANQTRTIQDLLLNSSVSWKYYDHPLGPYADAIQYTSAKDAGPAYGFWNPLAARAESYNSSFYPHFENTTSFFTDLQNRTLPQLSWIIPQSLQSDHPPADIRSGENFVASIVDTVASSPYWNSTAIMLFWDDYGGFYDHVPPAQILTDGLGFRVPVIVISPWTAQNTIVHQVTYFDSLLHMAEWRFGLGCLQPADCNAPLPWGFFDFNQTLRPPVLFSTNAASATYPMSGVNSVIPFAGVPASVLYNESSSNSSLAD